MKSIPENAEKCIWMEAGVVSYKLCSLKFNCNDCQFDRVMTSTLAKRSDSPAQPPKDNHPEFTENWIDKFRKLPARQRRCRYMLQGMTSYKLCVNNFDCGTCSYDQMHQDGQYPMPTVDLETTPRVAGFYLPRDLHYHRGHSWVRPEMGGRLRVGIDDFARRLMGKVDEFKTPPLGRRLQQGEPGWQIRRNEQIAEVLAPADGVVVQVNHEFLDAEANNIYNPYDSGWLLVMEPANLQRNFRSLLYGDAAEAWTRDEFARLDAHVQETSNVAMSDGGLPVDDIFQGVKDKDWATFVKPFLLT